MKKKQNLMAILLVLIVFSSAYAQDNPVSGFAAAAGNNARTNVYFAPYIFGDGSSISVKWKKDLDVAPYDTRRNAWGNFVFDEDGYMYWRGGWNASQTQAGIIKTDTSDGSFVWVTPLPDTAFGTAAPIVGENYVYASQCSDANPVVYAIQKNSGVLVWQSNSLGKKVNLTMALYDGVLYGITERDATMGGNWAFAINASDGSILYTSAITTSGDTAYGNTAFAPDVFGEGEHGLYWVHDANVPTQAIYGIKMTTTSASLMWSNTPARVYPSNVIYNADKNAVYALHWADYGSAVESYDPVTGVKRWFARNPEMPGGFNGGFYMTHSLRPDGQGFIFGGFSHDVFSVIDPGDLGGGALQWTTANWFYDGKPDLLGESQTMAITISDWASGKDVYISGTTAAFDEQQGIDEKRRLFAIDASDGSLLWSWFNPGDANPYDRSFNFRCLSVGPDGSLYYQDAAEGPHGTLYCLTGSTPPPKPLITDVERIAGNQSLRITWTSVDNATYRIEYSDSPYDYEESTMTWTDMATSLLSGGTSTTYEDLTIPVAAGESRWYRIYAEYSEGDVKADDTVGLMVFYIRVLRNMVSTPLEPYPVGGGLPGSSTLDKIVGNQLTGHALNKALSDNIEVWDNVTGTYKRAWYQTGTVVSWRDWDTNGQPSFGIDADKGYWFNIVSSHSSKDVLLCGRVSKTDRSVSIAVGRNLVGSCFPVSCTLAKSGLVASGFTGHNLNRALSDNVEFWDRTARAYQRFWYKTGTVNAWQPWNVSDPMRDIAAGDSMWVNVISGHSAFTWTYPVPPRP